MADISIISRTLISATSPNIWSFEISEDEANRILSDTVVLHTVSQSSNINLNIYSNPDSFGLLWGIAEGNRTPPSTVLLEGKWYLNLIVVMNTFFSNNSIEDITLITADLTEPAPPLLVTPSILGQEANGDITYSYLYEPLRVSVSDPNPESTKLFADISILSTDESVLFKEYIKYVEVDRVSEKPISLDLMEIASQLQTANVFKIDSVATLLAQSDKSIINKYYYSFKFYSDTLESPTVINKAVIIGGREFTKFNPLVSSSQLLTEFEIAGIDVEDLVKCWGGYQFFKFTLSETDVLSNFKPIITLFPISTEPKPKGGVLYWKSRFGGWMFWGFSIKKKTYSGSIKGDFSSELFESTQETNGKPYVPVNYSSVESSYKLELKSLSLSQKLLWALSGISASQVVYYAEDGDDKLELMRLDSHSAPLSNLANGGDFSVSLSNISYSSLKTK